MSEPNDSSAGGPIRVVVDADLEDLVPGFLENRRADVDKIASSLDDEDFAAVRVIGHSMKGSGGGYGFNEITNIGRAIEEAARERDAERVRAARARLVDYLDRIDVRYE